MKSNQKDVEEFMVAAGQGLPDSPTEPDFEVRKLRVKLLLEEVLEFAEASGVQISTFAEYAMMQDDPITISSTNDCAFLDTGNVDMVEVADAICDIEYVNQGAGLAWGLDLEHFWDEVQRSNMSKFIDGHRREDGKWIKGPSYSPADLLPILEKQQGFEICPDIMEGKTVSVGLSSGNAGDNPFNALKVEE